MSARIEFCARTRLDELREALASIVKSHAAARAARGGRDSLTIDDIDAAWNQVVADKSAGCDISAARITADPRNKFASAAIERICNLKWALGLRVERKAVDNVMATRLDSPVVGITDIDEAWDAVTFGPQKDLEASALLAQPA